MDIYNSLAALNRGFDLALESLTILKQEGVLGEDYVQDQTVMVEEVRAGLNYRIIQRLSARETEDRDHFEKMRIAIETRLKQ